MLVPKIMALDMPWKILRTRREVILLQKMIMKVETVKRKIPIEKIFFLPTMSASRPKGRRKIAEANKKLLATQPSPRALAFRSFPIAGSARLTAELIKGVRNAANDETIITDLLMDFSFRHASEYCCIMVIPCSLCQ
jgi:hypothetical protein